MKKIKMSAIPFVIAIIISLLSIQGFCATYEYQDGNGNTYQYIVTDGEVTISRFSTSNTAVDLVIPAEIDGLPVRDIKSNAFRDNACIESVIFPTSIRQIQNYAFSSCENLKSIYLPEGLERIRRGAFSYCEKLSCDLIIPSSLKRLDEYAFEGDLCLTSITFSDNSKCIIGDNAFAETGIESITLPEGTKCGSAFENCLKLKTVDIKGEPYIVKRTVIQDNTKTEEIITPSYMFECCEALETVTLSDSFELYAGMFSECSSLKSVKFGKELSPSVIEENTFRNCKSLEKTNININFYQVNQVDRHAFYNCENMDFDMQNDFPCLTKIANNAFYGCKKLHNLSFEKITSVGDYAFAYCDSLKSIEIPSGHILSRGTFLNCTGIETVTFSGQMSAGNSKKIFLGCTGIRTVILDNNFKMHKGDFNRYFLPSVLNVYSLPQFEEFKVGTNEMNLFAVDGVLYKNLTNSKTGEELVEIVCYPNAKKGEFYSTAEVLSGKDCFVFFGHDSFRETKYLKKIEITKDYLTNNYEYYDEFPLIDDSTRAFYYSSVEEIVFLKDKIDCIDESMFEGSSIKSIDLSNVQTICQYGFKKCKNLQDVDLSKCEYIYDWAFDGCDGLTTLQLINAWEIGMEAFRNCTGLKFVNFGINSCAIGSGAFKGCPNVSFYCDEDSKAYTYAVENNIPIISVNILFYNKNSAYEYTGSEIRPALIIAISGMVLTKNKDYTVEYFDNIEYVPDGYSTLIVHFIGDFEGLPDAYRQFYIVRRNISSANIEYVKDNVYDGEDIRPAVVISVDGKTLTENVDYVIEYKNGSDIGTMLFTVKGIGNYTGTVDCYYNIVRRDIAETSVEKLPDCIYTGDEICPVPVIKWNGFTLVPDEDFEVRYFENVNAGFGTAVIYGKGNFCGTQKVTFRIFGKDIQNSVITEIPDQIYTGSEIRPDFTVTLNGNTLTEGTDYTAEYINNTEKGTAEIIISGTGNYSGVIRKTFNIRKNSVYGFTVFSETQMTETYDGTPLRPEMEVYFGTERLTEGKDYEIRLENNISAGTATVTVVGIGLYEGERTYNFTILPCEISEKDISVSGSLEYNGAPVEPQITVTKDGKTLQYGKDYTVTYFDNTDVGTAYVTVEGIGNYCNSVNLEYEIYRNEDEEPETPDTPDKPEQNDPSNDNTDKTDNGNANNGAENGEKKPEKPSADSNTPSKDTNSQAPQIPNTNTEINGASAVFTAILAIFMSMGICNTVFRKKIEE